MNKKTELYNVNIESELLGALIRDNSKIVDVIDILSKDDFYKSVHQVIYQEVTSLYRNNLGVDIVTLHDRLKKYDVSITYLTEITDVATCSMVTTHSKFIKDKSILRQYKRTLQDNLRAIEEGQNIESIKNDIETNLLNISTGEDANINGNMEILQYDWMEQLEEKYRNGGKIDGILMGLDIDKRIRGYKSGKLYLVGARPAMGKSAYVINLVVATSIKQDKKVNMFSLEMEQTELLDRINAMVCGIPMSKLMEGNLSDEDWTTIAKLSPRIANKNLKLYDCVMNLDKIISICRKRKIQEGLDMIVIDYAQLLETSSTKGSREQEISEISRKLKQLSKELRCPIVALTQLNRAVEQRQDKRPMLSDLRESGALEQDADVVQFLYRDEYYNPDTDDKNIMEIIVAKHRQGVVGTTKQYWDGATQRIGNLSFQA